VPLKIVPFPIPDRELTFEFVRSSGPGGQNVNKVATAVQLRFKVDRTTILPKAVCDRLKKLAGSKYNADGEIVILARRFRSQDRNREDALDRLRALIELSRKSQKIRKKTAPSRTSIEKRLTNKKKSGNRKELRSKTGIDNY
jgi:ribosome-associated protein